MVLVEKDTQEPEHVIVVLLGLRFGFIRRHQKYLPETLSIQNAAWTRVFPTVGKVIDSAVHARDVRCIINMVHRTYLIFVKNALLLLVEAAAYGGSERAGEKGGGVARPGMEQVRVSLVVVFSNQPGSRAFSLGARLFAFYKVYSQKRIAAEMRCVDKRNFQT